MQELDRHIIYTEKMVSFLLEHKRAYGVKMYEVVKQTYMSDVVPSDVEEMLERLKNRMSRRTYYRLLAKATDIISQEMEKEQRTITLGKLSIY